MSHYREPNRADYNSEEEYLQAMIAWEYAEDEYAEYYRERRHAEE